MLPTLASEGVKVFKVVRGLDQSGVSGTGYVAYAIISHTGQVVLFWRSDISGASKTKSSSVGFYNSIEDFLSIHATSHKNGNDTELIFVEFKE